MAPALVQNVHAPFVGGVTGASGVTAFDAAEGVDVEVAFFAVTTNV
jgi:hypothetical protein